uniref:NADH:ubiquinone reductase (H(+)-translocating) n=1 Tax=Acropyga guianensis TaxID=602208 RepID=A0A6G5NIB7_9HYME|nr:NADH dehydrogenase subunit 5 [Acropyga guianensis]QBG38609.1 NADH dehydrogenase subunit 5 [Acropyga guianensis]
MNNLLISSLYMIFLFLMFFFFSVFLYFMDLSYMLEWMLFNFNSMNVEFFILVDWIVCLFISVVLLISSMIMLYSMIYMKNEIYLERYMMLLNLFILSMILMIISPNLISILFGWDGLGLISYCLVIFYQNYMSYNSGMVTILYNRIGDIGLLMSIGLMFMFGSWNMFFLKNNFLIVMMILIASITKSAQIPFSIWLPLAMAAPTPVSSLVHSSTLVTAGVYLMIRFSSFFMESFIMKILLYCSVFTMFMSGFMANFENDLKKIIALSTLSQLGLMMMILSLGLSLLSFFHLLIHAIFKSLLFMCAGIMIHLMNNNQDIRFSGMMNEFIPFTMMSFYMCNLSLMGFPFLSGFYSKDLIMEMIYLMNMNLFLMILILMSLSFTVSYSLRLLYCLFFSSLKMTSFFYFKENMLMNFSMLFLMILSLLSGCMMMWLFFFDNYFLFMKMLIKLLTIIFLIMGLMMVSFYMKNLLNLYFYSYFFSSMWFMSYMYMWSSKFLLNLSLEFYMFDKSWIEFMNKNFMLNFLKKIKIYLNNYKIYMFIMLNLIYLFMYYFFL